MDLLLFRSELRFVTPWLIFSRSRLTCAGLRAAIILGADCRFPVGRSPSRRGGRLLRAEHIAAPRPAGIPQGGPGLLQDPRKGDGVITEQRIDANNADSLPPNWTPNRSVYGAVGSVDGMGEVPQIPEYRQPRPPICNVEIRTFTDTPSSERNV